MYMYFPIFGPGEKLIDIDCQTSRCILKTLQLLGDGKTRNETKRDTTETKQDKAKTKRNEKNHQ